MRSSFPVLIDNRLVVWDLSTLTCTKSLKKAHSDSIIQVLATEDAIFTCSQDNSIKVGLFVLD